MSTIRGFYLDQIHWIFGKLPNGGGSFPIRKISLRFFRKFWGGKNNEFSEKGGGVRPIWMNFVANFWASRKKRNIVFRKFIEFGPVSRPLVRSPYVTIQSTCPLLSPVSQDQDHCTRTALSVQMTPHNSLATQCNSSAVSYCKACRSFYIIGPSRSFVMLLR